MKETRLTISPAPHWHTGVGLAAGTAAFILALLPTAINGIWVFGTPALKAILIAVAVALAVELPMRKILKRPILKVDVLSAVLLGLVFACLLPAGVPFWLVILGVVVASLVGRQLYGGVGGHPFHPAMVGYVVLLLSYPKLISNYPAPSPLCGAEGGLDLFALDAIKDMGLSDFSGYMEMYEKPLNMFLLGNVAGPIGMVGVAAILLGGLFLLVTRHIRWQIPVSMIATVAVLGAIFHAVNPEVNPAWYWHLASGGVLFVAFFVATDYTTSPANPIAMILFGVGIGILTILIRIYGMYGDGTPFAVLLMNLLMPLLDRIRRSSLGKVKAHA